MQLKELAPQRGLSIGLDELSEGIGVKRVTLDLISLAYKRREIRTRPNKSTFGLVRWCI